MKKYYIFAILLGSVFVIMYSAYGIAFWYGSNLIAEGISTPGSIFTVNLKLYTIIMQLDRCTFIRIIYCYG